mgnify:CR=1 FL=1
MDNIPDWVWKVVSLLCVPLTVWIWNTQSLVNSQDLRLNHLQEDIQETLERVEKEGNKREQTKSDMDLVQTEIAVLNTKMEHVISSLDEIKEAVRK